MWRAEKLIKKVALCLDRFLSKNMSGDLIIKLICYFNVRNPKQFSTPDEAYVSQDVIRLFDQRVLYMRLVEQMMRKNLLIK